MVDADPIRVLHCGIACIMYDNELIGDSGALLCDFCGHSVGAAAAFLRLHVLCYDDERMKDLDAFR